MRITTSSSGWLRDRLDSPVGRGAVPDRGTLLAQVAIMMRRAFARNFAESGRPEWAPLKPATQAEKMRLYLGGVIRGRKVGDVLVNRRQPQPLAPGAIFMLVRSGALRNAATRRGVAGNVTRIDAQSGTVEAGVNLPYGAAQNYGFEERNLPARPFLSLTDADDDEIAAWYEEQILAFLGGGTVPEESE